MPMKKHALATCVSSLILATGTLSSHAHAEYQIEAEVGFADGSADLDNPGTDFDYTAFNMGLTAYFETINQDGVPLNEQAFVSKASYASFGFSAIDFDNLADQDALSAVLDYRIPNQKIRLYAGLSKTDVDTTPTDSGLDGWLIGGGLYASENGLISLFYEDQSGDDLDSDEWTLAYEHFLAEEKTPIAFDAFVSSGTNILDTDTVTFGAGLDFYLSNELSLGGAIVSQTSDYNNGDEAYYFESSGRVSYWLNPRFNLSLEIASASETIEPASGSDYDGSYWQIGLAGKLRF